MMLEQTGWKCNNCEYLNTGNSLICENCGETNEFRISAAQINVCPICGQSDAIQRLSAVILGGKFYLPQIDGVGLGTSELARLLAPPAPPIQAAGLSTGTWIGMGIFFGFWPIALLGTKYLLDFMREYFQISDQVITDFESLLQYGIYASIVVFILVIGAMLLYHFITKKSAEKKFELDKPVWERAIFHWNLTYYCHRDGIVFATETDKVHAAQDIDAFLYSEW
jgi:RNA polymerase subunit RPABC4/transcription elongation factor Spt4